MRVKELIEKLKEMPQDNIVLYPSSSKEDGYALVNNVCRGVNEYDGVVFIDNYIEDGD